MPTVSSKCAPVTLIKSPDFTLVVFEIVSMDPFDAVIDVAAYAGAAIIESRAPITTTVLRTGIR